MSTPSVPGDYRAFIFDLDGVVTDTARYHFLAWKKLADTEGIPFDEAFNERLKGVDRMGSLELILARSDRFYSAEQEQVLAESKNDYYRQLIVTMSPADLLPGSMDALRAVRSAGLLLGLASVSKNASAVLDRLGIATMFDYVVDARSIAHGKPDPEIFLTAATRLAVPPRLCIGVEDAQVGITAINAAGMYSIGVGDAQTLAEADRVLPDLTAFRLKDYVMLPGKNPPG